MMGLRKGTSRHKMIGAFWVVFMFLVACSSFAITRINPGHFSWIHVLSVVTLVFLPLALWRRRQGDSRGHARAMVGVFLGLLIAGAFTLVPGRLMHDVFFGS